MEYKQEHYLLNKLCEFRDKEVEADFMEHEKASNLGFTRLLSLVLGFTFAMFILQDYFFFSHESGLFVFMGLRGLGLLITLAAIAMAGKFKRYEHILLLITITELLVFVIYLVILYIQKDQDPSIQFMTMMLFILAVFLIPNKWMNCLFAACVILSAYVLFSALFLISDKTPTLIQRGIYLGICLMSCAIFLYGRKNSQRRQFAAEKLLEFMSITDRLTGIYNRGRFEFVLNLWIKGMRHDPFCLLLFDIDDFKEVNDRLGHSAGDKVLIEITQTVTANIRGDDVFARWGGEEFVILFGTTDLAQAAELAERLRKAVEDNSGGEAEKVTISIGVAQYRRDETILDFINRADEKMYEAKRAGKNQVVAERPA